VVYEGQADNQNKAVFIRIISGSSYTLLPEIIVDYRYGETASVASLRGEQVVKGFENIRERFVVVYRGPLPRGNIYADIYSNEGTWLYGSLIDEGNPPPHVPDRRQLAPSIAIKDRVYNDSFITMVWSSGRERDASGELLNMSGTSTGIYDIFQRGTRPSHGIFDGTTSRSDPKFNACAQVAPILFEAGNRDYRDQGIVARVYQTDRGEIYVGVGTQYGTVIFGSAAVGVGDYPTITSLRWEPDSRKLMAVVAWHDPTMSKIKFRFVWVDPAYDAPFPVTVQEEMLASNLYGSSPSGRPAVLMTGGMTISNPDSGWGHFVIVWEGQDRIIARVFHLSGRPATPEIIISDFPGAAPSVIDTPSGFFVVWMETPDTWIIVGRPYKVTLT
jgi:hypothetical protein